MLPCGCYFINHVQALWSVRFVLRQTEARVGVPAVYYLLSIVALMAASSEGFVTVSGSDLALMSASVRLEIGDSVNVADMAGSTGIVMNIRRGGGEIFTDADGERHWEWNDEVQIYDGGKLAWYPMSNLTLVHEADLGIDMRHQFFRPGGLMRVKSSGRIGQLVSPNPSLLVKVEADGCTRFHWHPITNLLALNSHDSEGTGIIDAPGEGGSAIPEPALPLSAPHRTESHGYIIITMDPSEARELIYALNANISRMAITSAIGEWLEIDYWRVSLVSWLHEPIRDNFHDDERGWSQVRVNWMLKGPPSELAKRTNDPKHWGALRSLLRVEWNVNSGWSCFGVLASPLQVVNFGNHPDEAVREDVSNTNNERRVGDDNRPGPSGIRASDMGDASVADVPSSVADRPHTRSSDRSRSPRGHPAHERNRGSDSSDDE